MGMTLKNRKDFKDLLMTQCLFIIKHIKIRLLRLATLAITKRNLPQMVERKEIINIARKVLTMASRITQNRKIFSVNLCKYLMNSIQVILMLILLLNN
jgi:hypothetical protein